MAANCAANPKFGEPDSCISTTDNQTFTIHIQALRGEIVSESRLICEIRAETQVVRLSEFRVHAIIPFASRLAPVRRPAGLPATHAWGSGGEVPSELRSRHPTKNCADHSSVGQACILEKAIPSAPGACHHPRGGYQVVRNIPAGGHAVPAHPLPGGNPAGCGCPSGQRYA